MGGSMTATVTNIKNARKGHKQKRPQVRVKVLCDVSLFFWFPLAFFDLHIGEQGSIKFIERELYTVEFERYGVVTTCTYSREELEFL